jgi:cell division protein FtsA
MKRDQLIAGLDVGSEAIRMAIARFPKTSEAERRLNVIGAAEATSEGISKGVINSVEEAVSSISLCLEKAERMVGLPIESVWVGVSGSHIISQESKGIVAISRVDGEIQEEDIERVIEAARLVNAPTNYEILHLIPQSFTIDHQTGIKDPLGMTGIRLEANVQVIQGLSSQIKNLTRCIYRTGLEIEDVVFSILAVAEAVLDKRQKELGVLLLDIGKSATNGVVFEDGDVIHTFNIPIASSHITSDIAIGLRSSIDTAEKVKIQFGNADLKNIKKNEEINLADLNTIDEGVVLRKYVAEIIEARVEEIFERAIKELEKIDRAGKLPAGVLFTGGGAKLNGLVELAKKKFRLPSFLGYPHHFTSAIDRISDLSFATAVGLVLWGTNVEIHPDEGLLKLRVRGLGKLSNGIKKLFKSLIP